MIEVNNCECRTRFFVSQKKGSKAPTFENSLHQEYLKDLNVSNSSEKPKDQSMFVIFLATLPALEAVANSFL